MNAQIPERALEARQACSCCSQRNPLIPSRVFKSPLALFGESTARLGFLSGLESGPLPLLGSTTVRRRVLSTLGVRAHLAQSRGRSVFCRPGADIVSARARSEVSQTPPRAIRSFTRTRGHERINEPRSYKEGDRAIQDAGLFFLSSVGHDARNTLRYVPLER